ncbi:hypothetical protein ACFWA9_29190 [Kitasatospora sp. NPDC059973]|uniref:hypothetical protein n=1 Tax=Kitasatospora sp. NPDC059973 TaxID=3347020 RepID=UPI00368CC7E1
MTARTIARTATRKIAAIRETFTEARRYDNDRGEMVPCEAAAAWDALGRTRSARLLVNDGGDVHTVRVHSSLWYELREPAPQVAPAAVEEAVEDLVEEPLPAEVLAARPGDVVVTRDTLHAAPQYDVWIGREHVGVIFDETEHRLARPPFAAWSGKIPENLFFDTLDEAADAITAANLPAGPLGLTKPSHFLTAVNFRILPIRRRSRVLARAAEICGTGRAHARAFKQALQEDWTEYIASAPVPDESEFEHCTALGGGEIHTAAPDSPTVHPLCRTMSQDKHGTRYTTVTAAGPTCRHCLGYREGRAKHRTHQQVGRAQLDADAA